MKMRFSLHNYDLCITVNEYVRLNEVFIPSMGITLRYFIIPVLIYYRSKNHRFIWHWRKK